MDYQKEKNSRTFGAIQSPEDVRDYKIAKVINPGAFPEEYELGMVRIKNQGTVGACVAFSLSEVFEYFNKTYNNNTSEMSTGYIYGNRRNTLNKGPGMIIRDALSAVVKDGDVYKEDFPENIEVPYAINLFNNRYGQLATKEKIKCIKSYYRVRSDSEIKTALMQHGPVVTCIRWGNVEKLDKSSGILTFGDDQAGCHCVIIYGWDKNGWKIWNSWGKYWGIKGTCIIPFGSSCIVETWGVTSDSDSSGIIKPNYNGWFKRGIAKLLNLCRNLFKKRRK